MLLLQHNTPVSGGSTKTDSLGEGILLPVGQPTLKGSQNTDSTGLILS